MVSLFTEGEEKRMRAANSSEYKGSKAAIIRYIALVVLGLMIGYTAFLANASLIGHDRMPMPFGTGLAVVTSGSMEPALSVNDLVIVRKDDEYKKGDIIVWQKGSTLTVHRIISIDAKNNMVTTKGDANNIADEPFPLTSVRGKVCAVIPLLGVALVFLRSVYGLLILLALAVVLIEAPLLKKKKSDKEKIDGLRKEIERLRDETGASGDSSQK